MYQRIVFCFAILIGLTVNAQTINLRGVVSNQAGKPIANAILTLSKQGLKDTTGTDGAYSFSQSTAVLSMLVPQNTNIFIDKGFLEFSLPNSSPVKVEIYDVKGTLLKRESFKTAPAGFYRFNIEESARAVKLLVVKASIGSDEYTFRYLPLHSNNTVSLSTESSSPVSARLAKITAIDDTIKVTAANYKATAIPITSYDQQQNIALDTADSGSTGSVGCGKALSTLKTGTYSITSAGLSRKYIINIPANYDPDKPYRLIFAMHCMCGSMEGVSSDQFYQLKRFADSTNTPCIFVAPSVYNNTGCTVWNQNEKDHTFFDDMLNLFKQELCVDTTRVFSCGFSFGAMFTNSLAQNHQNVLRAVACYAPANYNIYLPTNTKEPIAYMSTTGMSDGTCPYVNSDANKQGGKYCSLTAAGNNGCTIPATITTATVGSQTHVLYEFKGCTDGYPVKLYTFDGGHQAGPMDGVSGDNSSKSWIPGETWKFFMQF